MKIMSFGLVKAHQTEDRTNAKPFSSDVFPCRASRKAESAGNGVLSSGEKIFSVHKTYMNFSRPRKRAPETALYALRGSLLPENGTNATPFLSDVYNNSTRASKRLAGVSLYTLRWLLPQNATDTTQPDDDVYNLGTRRGRMLVDGALSGRSMVEMLGVLAIIGVLSVGAISGYQKAMFKYQIDKSIDQINQTLVNTYILFNNKRELFQNVGSGRLMIKFKIFPEEMIQDDGQTLILKSGNRFTFGIHSMGLENKIYTGLAIANLSYEQCLAFLNYDWRSPQLYQLYVSQGDVVIYLFKNNTDNYTKENILRACNSAKTTSDTYIAMHQWIP